MTRPLTIEDVWAVKRVGAPSLSPDGRWAAVELASYDMESNERRSNLWLVPIPMDTSSAAIRLTTHPGRDSNPQWSPDGKWIAFTSKREGDAENQLYLISPAGGEARRLTDVPTGVSSLKWFADSRRIAFISWVWPDLGSDDEQARRLKERKEAKVQAYVVETTNFRFWDHWLADGREPHLFAADAAAGDHRDLLAGTGLRLVRHSAETELSASLYDLAPDGREAALTVDLTPDPGFEPNTDIVTLSLDDGQWTNITEENLANDSNPRYSPDGRWIAYTRQSVRFFYADRERIALYDRRSGAIRVLTEAWDRSAEPPLWVPDSRSLIFVAEDRARQPVWQLDLDGGEPRRVVEGATNSCIDLSRDGSTLAFLRTTMGTPAELWAAAADGRGGAVGRWSDGATERPAAVSGDPSHTPAAAAHRPQSPRRVEQFNDDLVSGWELGGVEEMTYAGWNDEPVQMWVIYPPRFDPGKQWPLLQIVHGGPHGAWLDQFHFRWNMHLFASRGYVVAAVNFHGSTGWGQAFTDANTGQYGTKELADVERGTDALIERGFIDPGRLAAAGGSFGGYMVAWMNGHTNRYGAYVCHAGVYDYVAQMASDTVRGRQRALGAFPWEDPERVLRQSAHWYAGEFQTPTLVIHGEQDYRVPVTQGFEYYTTLRMRGVPARLVYFPDENHWILKPQNSRLWYQEFFAWIERFVPPGPRG